MNNRFLAWARGSLVWLMLLPGWLTSAPATTAKLPQLAPIAPDQTFTFAVLGDNRGDDTGQQPAAFRQILYAMNQTSAAFAVNTGDMIYGLTPDEKLAREHWRIYLATLASFKRPMFHIPGNHDLWSEASARWYAEMLGPTYYSFDYGRARFIALDSETDSCRLGAKQTEWLRKQLEEKGSRIVFIFLHRPLFPVDGAIGSSMDAHPAERDQLHQLFVSHRDVIKGVFLGHEHLYHAQERDGVPYYITGGGGANLYMAPELGGFHHYLLVQVGTNSVSVELKKVGAPVAALRPPRRISPGEALESWEQGRFWFAWNYTVTTEITRAQASEGQQGLQVNFDLSQYAWPVLALPMPEPWDMRNLEAFALDVFLPANLPGRCSLTASVEGAQKREAPAIRLNKGWNTVRTALSAAWLPEIDRRGVRSLGWSLSCENTNISSGAVVFDNFRIERSGGQQALLESWERPLFWRVADESVQAETITQLATSGERGLKVRFDLTQCARPVLLARLNPPWDLAPIGDLVADIYMPPEMTSPISVAVGLRANEREFAAPPVSLKPGWNLVKVPLNGRWLPPHVRAAAEQIEWNILSPDQALKGWLVFDHLRTEAP